MITNSEAVKIFIVFENKRIRIETKNPSKTWDKKIN